MEAKNRIFRPSFTTEARIHKGSQRKTEEKLLPARPRLTMKIIRVTVLCGVALLSSVVVYAKDAPIWQNAYAERFIGSLRRECLDHIIILNESSLKRILKTYFQYYEHSRTHLSLEKDAPVSRAVQLPELGRVIELPQVGGLHHRYERRAA